MGNCGKVIFISEVAFIDGVQAFECSAVSHTNSKRLFYLYNTLQQCTVLNCVVRYCSVLFSLFSSLPLFYGPVSSRDNRVFNGPLGRSLRSFARTAHSAHSLRSAPLRYARFARSLRSRARSLTSLTPSRDSRNPRTHAHAETGRHGHKRDFCHH